MLANFQIPGLNLNQVTSATAGPATEVLCLMNMVQPEELEDEEEYDGLYQMTFLPLSLFYDGQPVERVTWTLLFDLRLEFYRLIFMFGFVF